MDRTSDMRRSLCICFILAVSVAIAFWPALQAEFINFDDPEYVTENPHISEGVTWDGLKWAATAGYAGNWHPMTWVSHMLDVQLYGLRPAGHHLTSVLLHACNALLLFLLLKRMTAATWRSAFVAAVFALHPLRVESVAWVSERKDVLSTFFFVLTLWAWTGYTKSRVESRESKAGGRSRVESRGVKAEAKPWPGFFQRQGTWYILAVLFFAFGLMSKPMLVTLPFVLLLLDYWPLCRFKLGRKEFKRQAFLPLLYEKVPFLALGIVSSVLTFCVQRAQGAMAPRGLPLGSRVANAVLSCWAYVEKTLWPTKLAIFYPHPATTQPDLMDWVTWEVPVGGIILIGITVVVVRYLTRKPYLAVGWFWFLGTLVPVIGLVQVGGQAMADRYTYIPAIGLAILLAWTAAELLSPLPFRRIWAFLPALAGLSACAMLTWAQAARWHDNIRLFSHALTVTRNNATAHFNLGAALELQGNLTAAMEQYRLSVEADPFRADAHYNLGHGLAAQGKAAEAEAEYQKALELKPDYVSAHNNLAALVHGLGRLEEAAMHYAEATRLQPDYAVAHRNYGKLLWEQGRYPESAREYGEALRWEPHSIAAKTGLGLALSVQGQFEEALHYLREVQSLTPTNVEANINLANALYDSGSWPEARRAYAMAAQLQPELVQKTLEEGDALATKGQMLRALGQFLLAVRLAPESADAHERLGLALARQGDLAGASTNFTEVVRLRPDARAHYNLALAYVTLNRPAEAAVHYHKALELKRDWPAALNDLAWLLGTCSAADVRNGKEAVRFAEEACRLAGESEPRYWGTLDAAYAEAGRFEDAIATAEKTQRLAQAAGAKEIAAAAECRLELYRLRRPWRQP